jgi:casein kinase II subunit alpha
MSKIKSNLDNYQILAKLGRGKYSMVFLAQDILKDEKVVVKMLKPVRKSKFEREVIVLKTLNHENILKIKGVIKNPVKLMYSIVK